MSFLPGKRKTSRLSSSEVAGERHFVTAKKYERLRLAGRAVI
jgi:hypothetical protein